MDDVLTSSFPEKIDAVPFRVTLGHDVFVRIESVHPGLFDELVRRYNAHTQGQILCSRLFEWAFVLRPTVKEIKEGLDPMFLTK